MARHFFHPVQVGTRTEGFASCGKHDDPGVTILIQVTKSMRYLGNGDLVERITYIGTVQPDGGQLRVMLDLERLISHRISDGAPDLLRICQAINHARYPA